MSYGRLCDSVEDGRNGKSNNYNISLHDLVATCNGYAWQLRVMDMPGSYV